MTPVKSTSIKAVGYDAAARVMTLQFHSGGSHAYVNVPPDKHAALMAADSPGGYFHANIRDKHKSSKVSTR